MPAGSKKSGTFRKIFVKLPGGRTTIHYKKRKPQQHKCAGCGKEIMGVPRLTPTKMKNLAKTKKRPERVYGGYFCGACVRKKLVQEARS